ncbi:ATP-binding cassette domain-containing protein [Paenibacillus sp. 1P07SE]|uniref:ATP-binding cassette domain-containing protein n=1 Tax=Paenibacillus sp. 1P07SE TaxID=3132209 RepID=UPI0039A6AE91
MTSAIPLRMHELVAERETFRIGPVNLVLEPGLAYALVGPNGSGKTTLMNICLNLAKPLGGELEIFGAPYVGDDAAIKAQIAYAPEPLIGCEPFTLEDMAKMIGRWYPGWDDQDFARRAAAFQVPLSMRYGKLSQGDRKKAALTLALSAGTPLLLLDEPTNGLDIAGRGHLKRMLAEDAEAQEKTLLLATHAIEDIRQFADYILLLRNGRLEGPFEKDGLAAAWSRLWLDQQHASVTADIPGAVQWGSEPLPWVMTRSRREAIDYCRDRGIGIMREQAIALDDILERLLA